MNVRREATILHPDGRVHLVLVDVQPPVVGEPIQSAQVVNGGWFLARRDDGRYQALTRSRRGEVVTDGIDLSRHTVVRDRLLEEEPVRDELLPF